MAKAALDDEQEKPLDPAVERVRKKLVRFVAINLGILFVALMAVVIALVYRNMTRTPAAPAFVEGKIALPAGARVVSQSLSGDRILIDAELTDGGRALFVFDIAGNRMVGRFDVGAE